MAWTITYPDGPSGTQWQATTSDPVTSAAISGSPSGQSDTLTVPPAGPIQESVTDAARAGDLASDAGPLMAPVISSPANGAGFPGASGDIAVQVAGASAGAIPEGAIIELWVNGAPYTNVVASGNAAAAVISYPVGSDSAASGDLAADAVRGADAVAVGAGAGTLSGGGATDAEAPRQGATPTDAATAALQLAAEAVRQGVATQDVATGPQLSVEVLRDQGSAGDAATDVLTTGGVLAAPTITSPASPYQAGEAPQVAITAAGAPVGVGAVVEFWVGGTLAGIVPADGAGQATWYLPLPFGVDAAQAGDIATDVLTPQGHQNYADAAQDGAQARDTADDAVAWREGVTDGAGEHDQAPQGYVEGLVDGAGAGVVGVDVYAPPTAPHSVDVAHARRITVGAAATRIRLGARARAYPISVRARNV